jgi:hypothetical protein
VLKSVKVKINKLYFAETVVVYKYLCDVQRFIYRLNRLKPRASIIRGPPVKVYNILNTVIGLLH